MWTDETRIRHDRSGLRHTHDLTDEEWAEIEPLIPAAKSGGDKRKVNVREIVNGLMYILGTGASGGIFQRTFQLAAHFAIISIDGATMEHWITSTHLS
jgi:hypothetical protein